MGLSPENTKVRTYQAGQELFQEGEPGSAMFILLQGRIELRKKVSGGEQLLKAVETPNDFFGEMAVLDDRPRSATAVATEASNVLEVDPAAFEQLVVSNGKFAMKIIKVLSERIRASNKVMGELVATSPRDRFLYGMVDYALEFGEEIFDKSIKVNIAEMKVWVNQHLGMPIKEIDAHLFRLIKTNETPFSATSKKTQDHIVLSREFVARHNRRACERPETPVH